MSNPTLHPTVDIKSPGTSSMSSLWLITLVGGLQPGEPNYVILKKKILTCFTVLLWAIWQVFIVTVICLWFQQNNDVLLVISTHASAAVRILRKSQLFRWWQKIGSWVTFLELRKRIETVQEKVKNCNYWIENLSFISNGCMITNCPSIYIFWLFEWEDQGTWRKLVNNSKPYLVEWKWSAENIGSWTAEK
jgi:hypothetical protein